MTNKIISSSLEASLRKNIIMMGDRMNMWLNSLEAFPILVRIGERRGIKEDSGSS